MNPLPLTEFVALVREMRERQRLLYDREDASALHYAKHLERLVDAAIAIYTAPPIPEESAP